MPRVLKRVTLAAVAISVLVLAPAFSSATPTPPSVGMGECHDVPTQGPTIPNGSINPGTIPVTQSQPWVLVGTSGEVGLKGSNGFIVVRGNATNATAGVQGRLNAADLNGQADVTPNAPTKARICLSLLNNRVIVPIP